MTPFVAYGAYGARLFPIIPIGFEDSESENLGILLPLDHRAIMALEPEVVVEQTVHRGRSTRIFTANGLRANVIPVPELQDHLVRDQRLDDLVRFGILEDRVARRGRRRAVPPRVERGIDGLGIVRPFRVGPHEVVLERFRPDVLVFLARFR